MNVQSIKDKLKNIARKNHRVYQEVLTVYALERTIYRISKSDFKENFTLKGGIFLYALYDKNYPRSTTDIDLRADRISSDEKTIKSVFERIFSLQFDDGLEYDLETLVTKQITKQDEYQGINISVTALLGNIKIPVSIDIGFGDIIVPGRMEIDFPVLLDFDIPHIYSYSIESTLSEKFEAIVSLGLANTRFKDFYDIYVLLQSKNIDDEVLKQALVQTFSNRNTTFNDIVVFDKNFSSDAERQKRWNAFTKKKTALMQVSFEDVVLTIKNYFGPLINELNRN